MNNLALMTKNISKLSYKYIDNMNKKFNFEYTIDCEDVRINIDSHLFYKICLLAKHSVGKVHIREYCLDSSMYSNYQKNARKSLFIRNAVKRDIQRYYSLGIRSITTFAV